MGLIIRKVEGGYSLQLSPPHARTNWVSIEPLSYEALVQIANEQGVHAQDFWDAALEADPQLWNT